MHASPISFYSVTLPTLPLVTERTHSDPNTLSHKVTVIEQWNPPVLMPGNGNYSRKEFCLFVDFKIICHFVFIYLSPLSPP